jgi:signal transduction histidine kinase
MMTINTAGRLSPLGGRRQRADLLPVVRHAVEAARPDVESAGHSLVKSFPAHPVWVDIDADRIAQVVTNL